MDIDLDSEAPARQPRAAAPERQMSEAEPPADIEVAAEPAAKPNPEQAVAEAQRQLAQRDRELADARRREQDAHAARSRAEREAERANHNRVIDRQSAVAAAVDSATSEKEAARSALRAARESGDIDAEIKATEQLSAATYRLTAATAELQQIKAQAPEGGQPEPTPNAGGITPEVQRWINAHPRFNTDDTYRRAMLDADYRARSDGIVPGSPAYFREMDKAAAELEGGREPATPAQPAERRPADPPAERGFQGAPPSRGNAATGGGKTYNTPLGPVTVFRKANGLPVVSIPDHLRVRFEEGARVCGMKLGEYALDQALHGTEGWVNPTGEDGQNYR